MSPTDNPWPLALLCLAVGAVLFGLWVSRQKLGLLLGTAVCGLLMAGCFLVDAWVQTPAEQVVTELRSLVHDFEAGNQQATLDHLAAQNLILRKTIEVAMSLVKVKGEIRLTDISVEMTAESSQALTHFRANADVSLKDNSFGDYVPTRWELTWQREGGQWKVQKVQRLDPITGKEIMPLSGGF